MLGQEKILSSQAEQKKENQVEEDTIKRRDNILDKIQEHIKFLNEVETVKKLMSKYDFEYSKIENAVENLASLAEDINSLTKNESVYLSEYNSLADIVGNSMVMDSKLVMKRINTIKQIVKEGLVEGKISQSEYKSKSKEKLNELKSFLDKLKKSLDKMEYYIKAIRNDKEKFKMELSYKHGYLEKFKKYFCDKISYVYNGKNEKNERNVREIKSSNEKLYPTGINKIIYFRFFDKLEKGDITPENLEEELDKLDSKFINKEKIKNDFEKGIF